MRKLLLLNTIAALILFATNTYAQALVTDSLFGNNGQISTVISGNSTIKRILQQPDNKTILCGENSDANCNCSYNYMVRVDACGQIDSSFGTNGVVHHTFDQRNISAYYELQPDGKILVSGVQSDGNAGSQQFPFIARYNSDGSVDSTFGTFGTNKISNLGPGILSSIFLMDNGKILCTGSPNFGSNLIMRFDSTGAVDNSFGTNGVVQHSIPPGVNFFYDFKSVMRSDGKIVSVAPTFLGSNNDKNVVLSCFDTLGVLDTTFGTNGYYIDYNFVIGADREVVLQSDDKVIVAQQNLNETEIRVARYNTNGSIDSTYGTNGYIIIGASSFPARIKYLSKFNDDKILVGYQENGIPPDFKKYDANGILDTDFSLNGGNTFQFANADLANRAISYANDELLMGGSQFGFSMTRFVLNSTVPHITQTDSILNSNVSAAGATFQWYLNGALISGATDSVYIATLSGTYMVEATNAWGCVSSDSTIFINTGIATTNGMDGISIYPNPVNETLNIAMPASTNQTEYFITDAVGKIVLSGKFTGAHNSVDMHSLSPGIYFLKTILSQTNSIIKIVKN